MSSVKLWSSVFISFCLVFGACSIAGAQTAPAAPATPAAVYQDSCGGCHFAYQPFLLPSGSWDKLLSRLPSHFDGQDVELDPTTVQVVLGYLKANAAERSNTKPASKFMKSLGGAVPERITEIPYVQHKHSKLGPETFKRKSVGSLANCIACHKTADRGDYGKRGINVPK